MRSNLPDPSLFLNKTIPGHPKVRIQKLIDRGNDALVFLAVNESTGYQLACRIVPPENLPHDEQDRQEWLWKAKRISNEVDNAAAVRCEDDLLWEIEDTGKIYVAFLFQYIPGENLKNFINKNKNLISISFIESFLSTMFALLNAMKLRSIVHGDFHAGNVIVASPSSADLEPKFSFKVIDFGVHHISSSIGGQSDYHRLAEMLRMLLEAVDRTGPGTSAQDKFKWDILRNDFLQRHLIEDDPLIDSLAKNPRDLYQKLQRLGSDYQKRMVENDQVRMITPFDYPNCEQMGNLHLLLEALYSDQFLGLPEIESRMNLVLTGPRGCGKTTVFRALSFQHKVNVNKDQPKTLSFIGIYYRCDDLYFTFPRYKKPENPAAVDIPLHFLTATLLQQTIETFQIWMLKYFPDMLRERERELCSKLWLSLGIDQPNTPDAHRLNSLLARLQKERTKAAEKYRFQHDVKQKFGQNFGPHNLLYACQVLIDQFEFMHGRPFYFFIDDYSDPKITYDLQENLNRMLLQRSPACFFKISTESPVSFVPRDIDGKCYVETREYELLNLGIRYIKEGSQKVAPFLDGLFERRFREVENYPVTTLLELIGSRERNENEFARELREKMPLDAYAGRETLAALCSGDIHYMIRLVGAMVAEVGGTEALRAREESPKIRFKEQHRVITTKAGEFLNSVRMLPEVGQRLADIVTAFGNVARSYLKYRNSKNVTGTPPHQAMRIEPYESFELTGESLEIFRALLRYSIFLEDPRGKSRRGSIVPRYYLRRYLIPKLNLTLSGRDSIEVGPDELTMLLTRPKDFEDRRRLRCPNETGTLFDSLDNKDD